MHLKTQSLILESIERLHEKSPELKLHHPWNPFLVEVDETFDEVTAPLVVLALHSRTASDDDGDEGDDDDVSDEKRDDEGCCEHRKGI